jgi:signal transduction histidine kinase
VTALGKLFRTTAFKLSLAYFLVFAVSASLVMGWVAWNMRRVMNDQLAATIEAEIKGLAELPGQGGIRRIVDIIDRRARQPGASLYLITNFVGQPIAGNIVALPPDALREPGLRETTYERLGDTDVERRALARVLILPGGFRLLVGRDLEDREAISALVGRALVTSLFWLAIIGAFGGLFVARRVLRRVDAMNASAQTIMQGNLAQRLPVGRSNDELDRLADNLNAMLERIQELMVGLREVSDNIAHDLKTPLTRLRNRAEEALRTASAPQEYRAALEKMIDESDQLIAIFNALLMIARLEAGSETASAKTFDLSLAVRDVVELYEPLAEDAGVRLIIEDSSGCFVNASRELMGQAIANLIDNALKYGARPCEGAPAEVSVSVRRVYGAVEVEVADRGPGIPPEDRDRVLGRFVRLEGSRSQPGSGLGLSLAAAVARLHNGSIRLEDNAPGLRAIITTPAATGEATKKQMDQ